ncbi:hypothetical protein BH10BAC4_BH10BAC4_16400 [soil metagenome]
MIKSAALLLGIFASSVTCAAQGASILSTELAPPDWVEGLQAGTIPGWIYLTDMDLSALQASSNLAKHLPSAATDGSVTTYWAEGKNGPGIGEVIVVDFNPSSKIWWIWGGDGKSTEQFLASNRPKRIMVYLLGTYCHECSSLACAAGNFVVVNSLETELQDRFEFQNLPVPQPRIIDNSANCEGVGKKDTEYDNYLYKLAIQILSVYPGDNFNNTCISEIMDHGTYTNWFKRGKKN